MGSCDEMVVSVLDAHLQASGVGVRILIRWLPAGGFVGALALLMVRSSWPKDRQTSCEGRAQSPTFAPTWRLTKRVVAASVEQRQMKECW